MLHILYIFTQVNVSTPKNINHIYKVLYHQKNVGLMPNLDCNSFREYGFFYSLYHFDRDWSLEWSFINSSSSSMKPAFVCLMQCVLDPLGGDEAGVPGGRLCVQCHRPLQPICQHCRWSALASQLHKTQSGRFKASAGPCRSDMAQHSSQWNLVAATRSS